MNKKESKIYEETINKSGTIKFKNHGKKRK